VFAAAAAADLGLPMLLLKVVVVVLLLVLLLLKVGSLFATVAAVALAGPPMLLILMVGGLLPKFNGRTKIRFLLEASNLLVVCFRENRVAFRRFLLVWIVSGTLDFSFGVFDFDFDVNFNNCAPFLCSTCLVRFEKATIVVCFASFCIVMLRFVLLCIIVSSRRISFSFYFRAYVAFDCIAKHEVF